MGIYLFRSKDPNLSASFDLIDLLASPELARLGLERFYIADVELGTEIMRGQGVVWGEDFDVNIESASASGK